MRPQVGRSSSTILSLGQVNGITRAIRSLGSCICRRKKQKEREEREKDKDGKEETTSVSSIGEEVEEKTPPPTRETEKPKPSAAEGESPQKRLSFSDPHSLGSPDLSCPESDKTLAAELKNSTGDLKKMIPSGPTNRPRPSSGRRSPKPPVIWKKLFASLPALRGHDVAIVHQLKVQGQIPLSSLRAPNLQLQVPQVLQHQA